MTEIDLTDDDPVIIGQEWFVCSYISPKYVKNTVRVIKSGGKEAPEIDLEVVTAFKFRGAFPTEEKARERAKYLQSIDPTHNIAIGNSFKWFVLDPDLKHATDIEYYEDKLNQIMKAHDDEYKQIQKMEMERKKNSINKIKKNVKVNDKKVKVESSNIDEMINEHKKVKDSLETNLNNLKDLLK